MDKRTGTLSELNIVTDKQFVWSAHPGDVIIRDDLLRKTFDRRDLQKVSFSEENNELTIEKTFHGAPWLLRETYGVEDGAVSWKSKLILDEGDFRSCAISYAIPWPQPMYPISFWAAKDKMPSAPHMFAEIALEYGEATSGTLMPAMCSYIDNENTGLLLTMPFDFKTPRFRFISAYREPDLRAQFDWMALSTTRSAETSLLMRGIKGNWRSGLGWLYERFKEYFEPRSTLIDSLWGGHISGRWNVTLKEAEAMARLGLKWHEIHCHFPAYGNYHPEGITSWRSGHERNDESLITVDAIRQAIKNIHAVGAAAMPYIQVTGDGDEKLLDPSFESSRVRDFYGNLTSAWPGTFLMNSDPSLPFGKDMIRQIDGMVSRYPEMDGVFLDQPCYNHQDTAHDDGITAVNNRPAYMTGFNYFPHLEHLSSLLHPEKAIVSNAPFGVGILKYIDGFMAEGEGWLCDRLKYYGLAKPMFFLVYQSGDADIELMFQSCLIHGAGYSSYSKAAASVDLYDKYVPLVEKLFRRKWIFDPKPISFPKMFEGDIFRSRSGSLLASIVNRKSRLPQRVLRDKTVHVCTSDAEQIQSVTLYQTGGDKIELPFHKENGAIQFDIPSETVAAVAEMQVAE